MLEGEEHVRTFAKQISDNGFVSVAGCNQQRRVIREGGFVDISIGGLNKMRNDRQVALCGRHEQRTPSILIRRIDSCSMFKQVFHNIEVSSKMSCAVKRGKPVHVGGLHICALLDEKSDTLQRSSSDVVS
jgi:hypothetical protein